MAPPAPRFTSVADLGTYLRATGQSVPQQTVLGWVLAAAEFMVERYTRRRFAPSPGLRTDYTRQVVTISGQGQTNVLQLAGYIRASISGQSTAQLNLPITAAQLQAALNALSSVPTPTIVCDGGPLPSYPINVYMVPWVQPTNAPLIQVDSTGLGQAGFASVINQGLDSNPPVVRRFTTRGRTEVRTPDLRVVDPGQDPRIPASMSGGVYLYGRRLLPNQYFLSYAGYAPGGADEAIGSGEYAEPADHIILGYGYGLGMTLAQQFAYVLPQMYLANDLWITGRWGWYPTPPDIIDATYAVAARRYRERDVGYADSLVTPEGMSLAYFKTLPSSVQGVLQQYRVPNIALI